LQESRQDFFRVFFMQYLVPGMYFGQLAIGFNTPAEFLSDGAQDDPVVYSIEQADLCMVLIDLHFYPGKIGLEFTEGGPAVIELLPYYRITNIVVGEFENTGIYQARLIHELYQSEKPLRVFHGKSEEVIARPGLCGQPVPEIDL
jgi:hypothetical protein